MLGEFPAFNSFRQLTALKNYELTAKNTRFRQLMSFVQPA